MWGLPRISNSNFDLDLLLCFLLERSLSLEISHTIRLTLVKYIMEAAVKRFFQSQHFAVAGASNDVNKFGYKRTRSNHNHQEISVSTS